ncbi:von Willebrand factor type A domain-containing protein [Nocardiopsis sp. Huas11]|uniref:VWA domain-containing protein n=1 Tax=Nocardiopsis sp. Huas11 TaxID=2183912 RepID=UPI000EB3A724|nr:VWA domain-containing protein [Nocardiopsis sp. Huas11]RKS10853.1 von Willebrand factor type A domain-containing protein [Nocardiopsis sp. Huas11]
MRHRYRAYTGGPDPLAEPDPPTDAELRAVDELLALVAAADPDSDADREALDALADALSRYGSGERAALAETDPSELRRLLGPEGAAARTRLDAADHGLSPRELRRLGEAALRDVERGRGARPGGHAGPSGPGGTTGEMTGAFLPYEAEEDRPLDASATAREAALRRARSAGPPLLPEDLRVAETEPESAAAVCLLIDLSHSMVTRSLHEAAARTALALLALVRTRHPQDRVQVVGFGERAVELTPAALVAHDRSEAPGTNLHHALRLARAHVRRHRGLLPRVLVVTDGEPTAHLSEDGRARFAWPPAPRTVEATLAELDAVLREGAEVTFVLLADDPRLRAFRALVERRRGVRVVDADADLLGPVVLDRYRRR